MPIEHPVKIWRYISAIFRFGVLGLFVILMPNTVKKLKIEHRSMNSVCVFFLVSRNLHACSCMPAKKYPVTEIFPYIIFHNYVLWSAHFCRFYACLFVWWCLKRQFQQYFNYIVAVPFFICIDFLAIKRKRVRFSK